MRRTCWRRAVQSLYPGTQVTIGPSIENGFYYDFARNEPFTPDDFEAIEAKMREIIGRGAKFERKVVDREEAIAFFHDKGEKYKAQLIQDLPADQTITLYSQGDWIDLCRGPHMRSTADVGPAFKLMKVAGAYWRGDHRNAMLSRHLRHRVARPEGAGHLPAPARGSRTPRPSPRSARRWTCSTSQEEAVGSIFWAPEGVEAVPHGSRRICAAGWMRRATRKCGLRNWSTGHCGRSPGTGRITASTCSSRRCTTRTSSWR